MLNLTDVLLTEGKVSAYETMPGLAKLTYRTGSYRITGSSPVALRITNEDGKKLLITGAADIDISVPCARCLDPVGVRLPVRFDLEFAADDKNYIDGYNLDVDQLIHDEALLVWPERVLCREGCRGLCPSCGRNLNHGSCGCSQTASDPRMAKVLDIFSNFKEV